MANLRSVGILLLFCLIAVALVYIGPARGGEKNSAVIAPRVERFSSFSVIYPQVTNSGPSSDKINKVIFREVETFTGRQSDNVDNAQISYKICYNRNSIFSVVLKESIYYKRAAHPMSYQRSLTFNLSSGEQLALKDLFRPEQDYRSRINGIVSRQLAERKLFLLRPFQSIGEEQEFYLTPEAMVIYYQRYDYTPYVYGILEIAIPYSEIVDIIRPEYIK